MSIARPFVYRSSNGNQYYLHGGQELPYGLKSYSFSMDSSSALTSIPSGYLIQERVKDEEAPALVSKKHTRHFPACQWENILDIAEKCDTSFYLSEISSPEVGNRKSSLIAAMILELGEIGKIVTCPECQREIMWQIQLQKSGIA